MHVYTGLCSAIAINGFPTLNDIKEAVDMSTGNDLVTIPGAQFLFPSIKFNCAANITRWSFAGQFVVTTGGARTGIPRFQVWRKSEFALNTFSLISSTTINSVSVSSSTSGLFHYDSSSPIPVLPNDVLGIVTRRSINSMLQLQFLDVGSGNATQYYKTSNSESVKRVSLNIGTGGSLTPGDDVIPLVTVEMSESFIHDYCHSMDYLHVF